MTEWKKEKDYAHSRTNTPTRSTKALCLCEYAVSKTFCRLNARCGCIIGDFLSHFIKMNTIKFCQLKICTRCGFFSSRFEINHITKRVSQKCGNQYPLNALH